MSAESGRDSPSYGGLQRGGPGQSLPRSLTLLLKLSLGFPSLWGTVQTPQCSTQGPLPRDLCWSHASQQVHPHNLPPCGLSTPPAGPPKQAAVSCHCAFAQAVPFLLSGGHHPAGTLPGSHQPSKVCSASLPWGNHPDGHPLHSCMGSPSPELPQLPGPPLPKL